MHKLLGALVAVAGMFVAAQVHALVTPTGTLSTSPPSPTTISQGVLPRVELGGSAGPLTGTLTFRADGNVICTETAALGTVTCLGNFPQVRGTYAITAHYSGDGTYEPLDMGPITHVVTGRIVTLAMNALRNPAGQNAPIIVAGAAYDFNTPIAHTQGTLTFRAGGTPIPGCIGLSSPNQLIENCTMSLAVGTHAIDLVYTANPGAPYDTTTSAPLSLVVNTLSTPNWEIKALPSNPAPFNSTVGLKALVKGYAPLGTPTGTVTVFSSGSAICTDLPLVNGEATCNTSFANRGTYPITFTYSGNSEWTPITTAAVPQNMVIRGHGAAIDLLAGQHVGLGAPSSLTALLWHPTLGVALPVGQGTVTFRRGGVPIPSCADLGYSDIGVATCNAVLAAGPALIDATFNTTGNFEPATSNLTRHFVGLFPRGFDMSGDGRADLLITRAGYSTIWNMNGTTFTTSGEFPNIPGHTITHFADMDGDGHADMLWANGTGSIILHYPVTPFGPLTGPMAAPDSGMSIALILDLDNNGRQDYLMRRNDGAVWADTSIGPLKTLILGPGSGWSPAATGDFNGDVKGDILWKHTDGRHAIWLMNGVAVASGGDILAGGSGWSVTQVGDFDGDGKSDLLWQHTDGSAAIWLMDGLTLANGAGILPAATGWTVTLVGDFDGDGKDDLYFEHTDGRAAIYLMNGLVPTQTTQILNAGNWRAKRIQDLDGDGKADIVFVHTDGRAAVWLMNGTAMTSGAEILGPNATFTVSTISR